MRKLLDIEKQMIQSAKKKANKELKMHRECIRKEIKALAGDYSRKEYLVRKMDSIRDITGKPVLVIHKENRFVIDYEILAKYDKLIDPTKFIRTVTSTPTSLIIVYQASKSGNRGEVELYELPEYQRELLSQLPVVNVEER